MLEYLDTVKEFQSTLLMRGATKSYTSDLGTYSFQSTLLMRGATNQALEGMSEEIFQSTLLMRGATIVQVRRREFRLISIHAPHARSD